jgi:hypothetical protein
LTASVAEWYFNGVEKRKSKRVSVSGEVSGRVVLAADLDVLDLSLSGVRFTCCERIVPGSRIKLVIRKGGLQANLEGAVVRSTLKGGGSAEGEGAPLYEVGVSFGGISEKDMLDLEELIKIAGGE